MAQSQAKEDLRKSALSLIGTAIIIISVVMLTMSGMGNAISSNALALGFVLLLAIGCFFYGVAAERYGPKGARALKK